MTARGAFRHYGEAVEQSVGRSANVALSHDRFWNHSRYWKTPEKSHDSCHFCFSCHSTVDSCHCCSVRWIHFTLVSQNIYFYPPIKPKLVENGNPGWPLQSAALPVQSVTHNICFITSTQNHTLVWGNVKRDQGSQTVVREILQWGLQESSDLVGICAVSFCDPNVGFPLNFRVISQRLTARRVYFKSGHPCIIILRHHVNVGQRVKETYTIGWW